MAGSGNVFVADQNNNAVEEIDLSDPPSLSFPTATNVGSTDSTDGVLTVTVANSGNAVLNFPIPASGNNPSISADFTLDSTSSGTCPLTGSTTSTPGTLAAGATCTLPISFAPTVGGTISDSLVLTDTNLNATPSTTQTISLQGTGQLITPTLAFATIPDHTYGDTPFIVTATSLSSGTVTYAVTGSATILGSTLTITGTGTVTLTASQAAAGNYAVATATTSFNVGVATPTLAFATIPAHTYGDTPFTVTATSASSGAVTYTVTGPATILGSTLTITGTGTVTLTASQAATSTYTAATTTTNFNVGVGTPTLAFATIPAHTYGDTPFTVAATSASSGAVTYTVTGPATISGSTLTITGAGTVTLSASQAAAGNYATATATASFTVNAATPTLAFAAIPAHTYGDRPFSVTATSASSGAVTYTVTGAATISGSTVTITGAGTVTLSASQAAAGNYAAATTTTSFTVNAATPTLAFAAIPAHTFGDTPFSVTATSASSGAVTYTVTSGSATISGSTLTITGAGTVTLTASQAAAGNYAAATTTTSFTVNAATPTLAFAAIPAHTYGDTPFAVSATSNSTGAFTYTVVSGPATISGSTVTITGAGLVTLQGSEAADSNYAAGTQQATFFVGQAPLTVAANNATRAYGATNPAFTGSISGSKYSDSFTESFNTAAAMATPVGSYAITPSVSGSSLGNYTVSATNSTLNITQAATTTGLTTSNTSPAANQTITLTANVASTTSGTPTGTVTILDNGTALQMVTLTNGTASYTTTLAPGVTHTLIASYAGEANFLASASAATGTSVTVSPQDFTFSGTGSPATQTVMPGQAASFTYNLAPISGSSIYPGAVSLTVSGCPTGSTCTLSPTSFAANVGAQTVTLIVQTTAATARNREDNTPWSLALLLLPLAGARRLRRSSQRLRKLMLAAVFLFAGAALAGLSGCSGNSTPQQQPQNYSITVTAASGVMTHTSTVALNVQ